MPKNPLEQGDTDPGVTVQGWQEAEPKRLIPAAPERKTTKHPHEEKRAARLVGVTFPSSAWKQYLASKAAELGDAKRQSDLIVYLLSYAIAALEAGDLQAPDLAQIAGHQRAGEALDLFWEP